MKDYLLKVKHNEKIAHNIFKLVLESAEKLPEIKGGQFAHIEVPGFTLRRPFGIAEFSHKTITIAYAIVGAGTEALSKINAGTVLKCILPLGNGFDNKYNKVMLIGGGMGAAPLLSVIKEKPDKEYYAFYGFSSKNSIILQEESAKHTKNIYIATDDGSFGYNGRVTALAREKIYSIKPDAVFACGPMPMFRALKEIDFGDVPVFVSLEERMGCGVGACLVCACPVKKGETVKNVRVCIDGPVFNLKETVL